ncbi:hypothetical protein F5X68DRAFT_276159 [Plectosphaerella plurivora]|uniref:Uncharacterized protein n=1 Tax=Plectosphaerella plurivora TaxID=936078 RepID=A0A9P9ACE7_9PEZI|nr:hypothetical protein F5X68DRAFT_276159 [Plectosphaerella plurivora]
MTRTELVFNHLPRLHPIPVETSTQTASLRIIKHLNSPEDDEAQTLLCAVERQSVASRENPDRALPSLVVAKVYDSMFYSGMDVVAEADNEVAHESSAYTAFDAAIHDKKPEDSTLIRDFQLEFYGCWFFLAPSQDPNFAGKTRPVRLILNEYVEGLSISDMCDVDQRGVLVPLDATRQPIPDPVALGSPDVTNTDIRVADRQLLHWHRRMFIIDAIVDGLTRQAHMGVQLLGISPDQIIIEGGYGAVAQSGPYSTDREARKTPRVVVINYTRSITGHVTAYGANDLEKLPKPCSPIDRDGNRSLASLRGWWPADWEDLPQPDCHTIWPLWFRRTFDTPDYIRRAEAEPLLRTINEQMWAVEDAEKAKLPAKYQRGSAPEQVFMHETPGAIKAFVEECVLAQKERDERLAAEPQTPTNPAAQQAKQEGDRARLEKERQGKQSKQRQDRLNKEDQERLSKKRQEQPDKKPQEQRVLATGVDSSRPPGSKTTKSAQPAMDLPLRGPKHSETPDKPSAKNKGKGLAATESRSKNTPAKQHSGKTPASWDGRRVGATHSATGRGLSPIPAPMMGQFGSTPGGKENQKGGATQSGSVRGSPHTTMHQTPWSPIPPWQTSPPGTQYSSYGQAQPSYQARSPTSVPQGLTEHPGPRQPTGSGGGSSLEAQAGSSFVGRGPEKSPQKLDSYGFPEELGAAPLQNITNQLVEVEATAVVFLQEVVLPEANVEEADVEEADAEEANVEEAVLAEAARTALVVERTPLLSDSWYCCGILEGAGVWWEKGDGVFHLCLHFQVVWFAPRPITQ